MRSKRPGKLQGKYIDLEPLQIIHKEELRTEANNHPSVWTYFPMGYNGSGEHFDNWFSRTMDFFAKDEHWPFAVLRKSDQKIVGTTRFYDIVLEHRRLAIGSSWYVEEVQGTLINPECRFLLLTYAFEILQVNSVELITDPLNLASRSAMRILGALEEGVIRSHLIYNDGRVRDSILFSIINEEWPIVKQRLYAKLYS